jgi:mannan endo-1,4-beta-mannosidase
VLPRAAQRITSRATFVSALALLAATLSGCAGADGISADDLRVTPPAGREALTQSAKNAAAVSGSSASALGVDSAASRANDGATRTAGDGASAAPLALEAEATSQNEPSSEHESTDEQRAATQRTPAATQNAPAPVAANTMRTSGRRLLDSCGNVFVTRGVEQIFGNQLPEGNDWLGLLNQIASTGVNAVRILAGTDTVTVSDVDELLDAVAAHDMVAYIAPYGSEGGAWLARPEVRTMLARHERYILIDAFGEPTFDDRDRFVSEATSSLQRLRSLGYRVPLTVTANQFGRDLPSLLELGPEILAADPLHNTVFGWQAYWSNNGYYQDTYGFSLDEAVSAAAAAPFPIQLGLDRITDFPSDVTADFGTLMAATQASGLGWLWWDWYNPYGNENSLTVDGSATNLTSTGRTVINAHPASVQKTAQRACATR